MERKKSQCIVTFVFCVTEDLEFADFKTKDRTNKANAVSQRDPIKCSRPNAYAARPDFLWTSRLVRISPT